MEILHNLADKSSWQALTITAWWTTFMQRHSGSQPPELCRGHPRPLKPAKLLKHLPQKLQKNDACCLVSPARQVWGWATRNLPALLIQHTASWRDFAVLCSSFRNIPSFPSFVAKPQTWPIGLGVPHISCSGPVGVAFQAMRRHWGDRHVEAESMMHAWKWLEDTGSAFHESFVTEVGFNWIHLVRGSWWISTSDWFWSCSLMLCWSHLLVIRGRSARMMMLPRGRDKPKLTRTSGRLQNRTSNLVWDGKRMKKELGQIWAPYRTLS